MSKQQKSVSPELVMVDVDNAHEVAKFIYHQTGLAVSGHKSDDTIFVGYTDHWTVIALFLNDEGDLITNDAGERVPSHEGKHYISGDAVPGQYRHFKNEEDAINGYIAFLHVFKPHRYSTEDYWGSEGKPEDF